uniref:Uncharacterized protein n=1 Tax=Oryza meridionalis TaxID=40149 RepID=A0A0E0C2Q7_9ORYZ
MMRKRRGWGDEKRRSKWSSVPPRYRTHHSCRRGGYLDHNAREHLLMCGGTLLISLVLLGVGRSKFDCDLDLYGCDL